MSIPVDAMCWFLAKSFEYPLDLNRRRQKSDLLCSCMLVPEILFKYSLLQSMYMYNNSMKVHTMTGNPFLRGLFKNHSDTQSRSNILLSYWRLQWKLTYTLNKPKIIEKVHLKISNILFKTVYYNIVFSQSIWLVDCCHVHVFIL